MHECRKNLTACALNKNLIYVFGGKTNTMMTDSVEKYNVTLNEWTILKVKLPMPL